MPESSSAAVSDAPTPEALLVGRILGGDAAAFERLMRQHNRRLFRVARSILRDDAEAEDALQESYLQAYRALGAFRGDAKLSTWLTRIVVNEALARRRRPQLPAGTGDDPDAPPADDARDAPAETPETLAMRGELRRLIERSIDGLPETYRGVFMLRAVEGLSVEETAASLGISEASTRTRFHRARAHLRSALGQQLGPLLENAFAFDGGRCDRIVARVLARVGPALFPPLPQAGTRTLPAPEGDRHG